MTKKYALDINNIAKSIDSAIISSSLHTINVKIHEYFKKYS